MPAKLAPSGWTVKIKLPQEAVDALEKDVSTHHVNDPGKKTSTADVIADLLTRGLESAKTQRLFALTHLITDAIAAARRSEGDVWTLADLRELLPKLPRRAVDEGLLELEALGQITLASSALRGTVTTARDRAGGILDPSRGLLLYLVSVRKPRARRAAAPRASGGSRRRARAS